MKKLSIFILLLPSVALCEVKNIGGRWGGLHNSDSSIMINDNEAQDLQDVDISESGFSVRKRSGYSNFKNLSISTIGVRGAYNFYDANGSLRIIHANHTNVSGSTGGGDYSEIVTTAATGAYWDFTDFNGSLWASNSARDEIFSYDGSAVTYYPLHPKGTQIEAIGDRLAISGTTANPNRIHFSATADFTDFTVGNFETSAFTDDIGLPGQKINAIYYVYGRLLAFTQNTMSFWAGRNQFDAVIEGISTNIGTVQPNSIIEDLGILYWQAQDNHFYSYNGNNIYKLSHKLDVSNITSVSLASKIETSQEDFGDGDLGVHLTATESLGDVIFKSSGVIIDNFDDGDTDTGPAWTFLSEAGSSVSTSVVSGELLFDPENSGTHTAGMYTTNTFTSGGGEIVFNIHNQNQRCTLSGGSDSFFVKLCTSAPSRVIQEAGCDTLNHPSVMYEGTGVLETKSLPADLLIEGAKRPGRFDRSFTDQTLSVWSNDFHRHNFTGFTERSTYSYLLIGYQSINCSANMLIDDIYFRAHSSTFTSDAIDITDITTFDLVNIDDSPGDGGITHGFYTDTDTSIDVNDTGTFVASQTITSGQIPSIPTSNYARFSSLFTRTRATQTLSLSELKLNHHSSGAGVRTWASVDNDHRVMWAVSEGSTIPNRTYIYDVKHDSWLKYSFPMVAATRVGDVLYFGGVSTGVVYSYPSGADDDGTAIDAYWKSKDFIAPDPFIEKDYKGISFLADSLPGSNIDITYITNTGISNTYNVSLADPDNYAILRNNRRLPSGTFGTFLNIQFGNDDSNAPFEMYLLRYEYEPRQWRPLP